MIGISMILLVVAAGTALSALIGVWIGKAWCSLTRARWDDDDPSEGGNNPL